MKTWSTRTRWKFVEPGLQVAKSSWMAGVYRVKPDRARTRAHPLHLFSMGPINVGRIGGGVGLSVSFKGRGAWLARVR
jgi:hypothetical protein